MNNLMNVNMDSVINKLRNTVTTVTSTVSQLSVVLPGNPVTREFEVTQHIGSGGPGLMWKIYSGYKKSTKQEAAIFVFEKKQLEKWSRKDRDNMIETLKKGVSQLTRLRHPRILTVQHPLEESRDSLAFATEPVFASLATVMGCFDNMPQPIDPELKHYSLHPIEIKLGLLQVCEGITFLHGAKILHGNVCPESIIINQQGAWKIFGLDFSLTSTSGGAEAKWTPKEFDYEAQPVSQQNLDFLAPEYVKVTCSAASDMYSLGMLLYAAFNDGKSLYINCGSWQIYKQNIEKLHDLMDSRLGAAPPEMRTFIRNLLSHNPLHRPDSHEFSKLEALHDEGVKTLNYLDSLFQWDNLQKSKFYKGLSDILPTLPQRVRVHRVVPCLAQEFVNPSMVPFVLPNVLKIAEWASPEEYVKHVLPHLRDVMKLREPVQVLFIFMKNMELLLQKTPPDITKSDVLPLIYGSLESDSVQVQELCLAIIPGFAGLIDYPAMKNSLLPRIRKLCLTTPSLSVRVNCLVCLGKILDHLDKWLVIDVVLPFLTEIPSRESAVIMGIIGIYKLAVNHKKLGVTKEIIATKILPFVFPLTIENGLTTQQFSTVMSFVYDLVQKVEAEHKVKLEELGAITREKEQMKAEINSQSGFGINDNLSKSSSATDIFGDFNPYGSSSSNSTNNAVASPKVSNDVSQSVASNASRSPYSSRSPAQNTTKDLTSTLMESNLRQMHSQQSTTSRMTTSMSMPMGVASMPPQQMTMMNSYYPSANNNLNSYPSKFGASNVPRSQTTMNMNSGPPMGMMNPRLSTMNHQQQSDSNTKILSKQDIDEFLR
ncbi:SCY1-like protein 2 [Orchesella cincta]|uniref:SCY1-like protein 2 n=1 Tax=Orchesella cincta TaxID=48709 RepID=A0A1D2M6X1_ORCCI|nr:SCY1-like protein 2 [Orchesella cincta]